MSVSVIDSPGGLIMPPRSRLYSLKPYGLGTGNVESLTSFITRLADAHCLPVWMLVSREVAPLFSAEVAEKKSGTCDLFKSLSSAINGNNGTALRMTEVISELTGLHREVLLQLTLASSGESLARKPLLSKQQKWCSICLQEARQAKREITYALAWQLAAVHVCHAHHVVLSTRCPRCDSVQLPLMRNNRVGCCGRCGAWLSERSVGCHSPSEWELFAARESANFIQSLSNERNGKDLFAQNLATVIDHLFSTNVSACGRTIATKSSTMSAWLRRQQRPSFPSLLLLSFAFGISTHDLLNTEIDACSLSEAREIPVEAMHMIRPALRTHNLNEVRTELERTLSAQAFPPPSLKAICKQLEINQSFVMRKLPELAAKVRDHHRFYLKTRKEMGEFFRNQMIESTAVEIYLEGQYPSQDRVERRLKNGVSLRSPSAKETWCRVVNELGFPKPPKGGLKMAAERSPCTDLQRVQLPQPTRIVDRFAPHDVYLSGK
jgi:hypothetical protein